MLLLHAPQDRRDLRKRPQYRGHGQRHHRIPEPPGIRDPHRREGRLQRLPAVRDAERPGHGTVRSRPLEKSPVRRLPRTPWRNAGQLGFDGAQSGQRAADQIRPPSLAFDTRADQRTRPLFRHQGEHDDARPCRRLFRRRFAKPRTSTPRYRARAIICGRRFRTISSPRSANSSTRSKSCGPSSFSSCCSPRCRPTGAAFST